MVLGSFTSSRGGGLLWICSCPGVPHLRRVPSNPTRTPSRACSSTRESRVFQNGRSIPLQRIVASASFTTTTCRRMSRRAPGASKAVSRSCRRHTDPMYKTPAQPSGLSRHGSCHGADSPAAFPASFRRRGQSDCGGFPDFHRSCLFSSAETDTRAETLLPPLRFCLRPSVSHKATCCFATCTRCFLSSFPSRSTTPLAGSLPVPHAPSQNSPCSLSISHAPARAHMSTAVEHLRTFPSSSVHLQLRIASVSGPLLSDFSKGSSRSRWSCAAGLSFISSSFVRPFSTTKGTGTRDSNSSADADSANSSASSSGNSLSGTSRQGGDAREGGSRSRVVVPPPVGSASKGRKVQLSKKELKAVGGHPRRYKLMGGRPEFHHVDRNRNGHIIEPTDKFQVRFCVLYSLAKGTFLYARAHQLDPCTALTRNGKSRVVN